MKLKVLLFFIGIFLYGSFTVSAQQYRKKGLTPMQIAYQETAKTPFTAKEMRMLREVYGEQLQEKVLDRPQFKKDIKHYLRNRIVYFKEPNVNNHKKYELLSTVPLHDVLDKALKRDVVFNKKNFNPLKYQFPVFTNKTLLYRIDNTNHFILIKPQTGR